MIDEAISKLATYALRAGLIEECERTWAVNTILDALKLDSYTEPGKDWEDIHLAAVLDELLDDAYARGVHRKLRGLPGLVRHRTHGPAHPPPRPGD